MIMNTFLSYILTLILIKHSTPLSLPPAPMLKSIPLPLKLTGGLFLFRTSVVPTDKDLSTEILSTSQSMLRSDPLLSMELSLGLESSGIFSSCSSIDVNTKQMVMEFQINGGNSWAMAKVHGVKIGNGKAFLVSLEVSNMDAALMGGSVKVKLPSLDDVDK